MSKCAQEMLCQNVCAPVTLNDDLRGRHGRTSHTLRRAHTRTHTGRLVQQGQIWLTFPVLVNFCLFVVVVTSAPWMNAFCFVKYQRHIFLSFVVSLSLRKTHTHNHKLFLPTASTSPLLIFLDDCGPEVCLGSAEALKAGFSLDSSVPILEGT